MKVGSSTHEVKYLESRLTEAIAKNVRGTLMIRALYSFIQKQVDFSKGIAPAYRGESDAEKFLHFLGDSLDEWI